MEPSSLEGDGQGLVIPEGISFSSPARGRRSPPPQGAQPVLPSPKGAAQSSFSTPWDPDFAQPPKPSPAPAAGTMATGRTSCGPAAGTFLLLDRPEPGRILEPAPAPAAQPPHEFLDFVKALKPFAYSQERFIQARNNIEEGRGPAEPSSLELLEREGVAVSTGATLRPPPPELELPAQQMSLSITGRKIIGLSFSEKRYLHEQTTSGRPAVTNLFDIQQQLQLRMQGKVGPKITINIDYDDTKTNQQDISIVYQGSPNEVVQNVSFGDIDLSLPPTEFVSYNKQLFGIRADIKWQGLKAAFIGSRTKGTTKFKEFVGNTQFAATDLLDTSYVRRQYYDVAFGTAVPRLPIQAGTEQVWLSQLNPGLPNVNQSSFTVDDLGLAGATLASDKFVRLSPGMDYTMDYVNGIIFFRTALQPQWAAAIDYVDAYGRSLSAQTAAAATGGNGLRKLIKTPSDVPIQTVACATCSAELGYRRELKTVYNLGQPQIVRDNGHGNFILQVLDQQRHETGSALNPAQKYPDTITVDFENGDFRLLQPFAVAGDSSTPDPDLYSPTPIAKRIIHVEYSYRLRTFFLEPSIVAQSEVVTLDNVKLNRNVDYFIDYDSGFITFFNPDRIHPQSTIDISYEVSPLGGISNESLLGTRVSYDFNQHVSLGSTLLYQAGAKSQTVPNITELARSLMVYDFDLKLKDIKLLPKLKASFAGEFAQSRQNLNLNDFALIDNMEGIKQEDMAGVLFQPWQIASNPSRPPAAPATINWSNEDVKILDINPRAPAGSNETQKVLDVQYDFSAAGSTEEASIAFPFSIAGLDFSQKTVLEVVMLGDDSSNLVNFRLGGIAEDADGSGILRTEDANGNGVLDPGEDIGWLYFPPGGAASKRYGADNGVLDSDDLNRNGRLDPDDGYGGDFGYMCAAGETAQHLCASSSADQLYSLDSSTHTKLDFGTGALGSSAGWQTFQIPLNISSANVNLWTAVKDLRISIRQAPGMSAKGTLKFAHIGVVGTTWQKGAAGDPATGQTQLQAESLVAAPVNSVDNPSYTPIYNAGGDAAEVFNDLYGSLANMQKQSGAKNLSEQSLQLDFSSMTNVSATVYTKRIFPHAIDISQHRHFDFLLYGNAGCNSDASLCNSSDHQFFLRAGNETNFFEAAVDLNFNGWRKIVIEQTDANNDSVMENWRTNQSFVHIVTSGTPSLQQIASLVAGVRKIAGPGSTTKGRVYLDEIYLADPVVRVGTAHSMAADFELLGWGTFGAKNRYMDRNFQTPTSVVSNQDNRLDSAYLNLRRISFFPMSFNLARTITDTPNTALTGNLSNLVNQLQGGKVTTWNGSAQGNFTLGAWPRLTLSYKRNRTEYELLTRLDDLTDYAGSLQYGVPLNTRFLPKTVDLNYANTRTLTEFRSLAVRALPGNANTDDLSQSLGLRLTFIPWTGSSLNPTYSLTKVMERRSDLVGDAEVSRRYPKSMTQSAGVASNFRIFSWLNPQANYQIDIIENSILNVSTFVVQNSTYVFDVGDLKTVNRSANGSVSLPLNIADIFPRYKLLRSVNIVNGYQIQDGDVWNNVESGYRTNLGLWVRAPLRPASPAAQLASRTLRDTFNSTQRWSPLGAYDITGRLAALKTFSISNNYVRAIQRSETTGTLSKTLSTTFPDLVASISQVEQLWFTERWMSNTQMNFRFSAHKTENVGASINTDQAFSTDLRSIVRKRFDTLISYNNRFSQNRDLIVDANTQSTAHQDATVQVNFNVRKFYFTPKVDYSYDATTLGTGVKTQEVTVITPSLLTRTDVALPRGLMLPGAKKPILFSNRVIWTTTLSLARRRSPVAQADNSDLASLNTSGDYEIAKNLRMTLNGAASRLWHRFLKEEEFISYQFGTTLTFQF